MMLEGNLMPVAQGQTAEDDKKLFCHSNPLLFAIYIIRCNLYPSIFPPLVLAASLLLAFSGDVMQR